MRAIIIAMIGVAEVGFLASLWVFLSGRWWQRPEGRHTALMLVTYIAGCAVFGSVVVFGEYPGVQVARGVLALLALATGLGTPYLFWQLRRDSRAERLTGRHEEDGVRNHG